MATVITAYSDRVASFLHPATFARNLWKRRDLIGQFTRREVEGRYRGSFLGVLWSFINPLVLLLIYTFVFGVIYKQHWPSAQTNNLAELAVIIFCGMIPFTIFSDSVGRASTSVTSVQNYVKKVVFPLEILPISIVGAAIFHGLVSMGILLVTSVLIIGHIQWTLPLLPLVALPLIFLSLGLCWFLASLGVFVRDMGYTIALVLQVLFFVTPIFYPSENIPEPFRTFIRFNPLTTIIENFRRVVLWGKLPVWRELVAWTVCTFLLMLLGYAWFMKTRKAFADVI